MYKFLQYCYAAAMALIALCSAGPLPAAQIVQAEYYIGVDPGAGNATAISLDQVSGLSASLADSTIALSMAPGTYDVGVRVKDDAGRWSNTMLRRFTLTGEDYALAGGLDKTGTADQGMGDTLSGGASPVTTAEYYIGVDPGAGNATAISLDQVSGLSASLADSTIALSMSPGTYDVGVRVKDDAGRWSNTILRRFTYFSDEAITATEQEIASGGLVDSKSSAKQRWQITLSEHSSESSYQLVIAGHIIELYSRPRESALTFLQRLKQAVEDDPWVRSLVSVTMVGDSAIQLESNTAGAMETTWVSGSTNLGVALLTTGDLGTEGKKITAAEYFIDVDPGEGEGIALAFATEFGGRGATWTDQAIPLAEIRAGNHRIGVRFRNSSGQWGQPVYRGLNSFALFGEPDETAPVISLTNGSLMNLPYGQAFVEPGYSASDNVDGNLSASVIVSGTINPTQPGEQRILYKVADQAGNIAEVERVVTVTDGNTPTITGTANLSYTTPPSSTNIFAGITALDAEYGDLSHQVRLIGGSVDWFNSGSYVLDFQVTDPAGNAESFQRTITLAEGAVYYPGFNAWIRARAEGRSMDSAMLGPDMDADMDGLTNQAEWAADTDPFDGNSKLKLAFQRNASQLNFGWNGTARIQYWLESSSNLSSWGDFTEKVNTDEGVALNIQHTLPAASPDQQFYRLRSEPRQPVLADSYP